MLLHELEDRARQVLSPQAYDYFAGAADDERTLAANTEAWERLRLRPHVLRDVSQVTTATTVLKQRMRSPLLVAPIAAQRLAHADGELAMARGAAAAGVPYVLSTLSTVPLEDVAAAAPAGTCWFQLYIRRDRAWSAELVRRAAAAGYRAVVLTVDMPVLGHRRRDDHHPPGLPEGLELVHFTPRGEGQWLAATAQDDLEPGLTFDDIGWVASLSELPVLVKGVLRGDDARRCVDAGAAGVVVSNHGGRQLDTAVTGAEALPEVVAAVGERAAVLVDGGIRSGTDVVKALALGAQAVLVGRPLLWALAVGGEAGVRDLLDELGAQTARALALCGATMLDELTPDLVVGAGWGGAAPTPAH
jgi:4-hydroxymandelate oxidase